MLDLPSLITLADLYASATGLREVTLSHRMFGDSKKLASLRAGADITVSRFNGAIAWLSTNWPDSLEWPMGTPRPAAPEVPREAAE